MTSEVGHCSCGADLPIPRYAYRTNCVDCSRRGNPASRTRANRKEWERIAAKPELRLRGLMTNRLAELCRKIGIQKNNSILTYLGCTPSEFKTHIESLFLPGMTWANRGVFGWHVDHIMPCALFDMRIEQHRHVCFHFSNLRPLWHMENSMKAAAIVPEITPELRAKALSVGVVIPDVTEIPYA